MLIKLLKIGVNQADKYSFAIKDLSLKLGLSRKNLTIEGFDISHHGGQACCGFSCEVFISWTRKKEL